MAPYRRHLLLLCMAPFLCLQTLASEVDYLQEVKPLLKHKCYACHGALKQQGGLRLDTVASLLKGGESGATVVSGRPKDSLLVDVLTGDAGFQMPPANEGAALTESETEVIRQWIAGGITAPENESPQADPKTWWSYQPNRTPERPAVQNPDGCQNTIDYFVAAERERRGLPTAQAASRSVWLRRVHLDLTGLPPDPGERHRFLADDSDDAWESVVDDLLSRPQYGERWGRHWMDVWRYSDWYGSRGINEIRYSQRHIWRWRDWIVSSLNADKGYDRMIQEMLAADEIAGGTTDVLPATGYLGRNWYKFDRNVWMFDTVEKTGEAFLGMTFRCCRCHDHKFDPITQKEYYRFRAFFEPHDVRTDPISALVKTQKDSTLGPVLNDGIALVFDRTPDAPTYLFERGDSRYPDTSEPLTPGVPAALGGEVELTPVELPPEAWYPMLRAGVRETLMEDADSVVRAAANASAEAASAVEAASVKLASAMKKPADAGDTENPDSPVLSDDFSAPRPDDWEFVSGKWEYKDGRLSQTAVTSFATMVSAKKLPADFKIHLRYRTLNPGTYRSVGFSFDYLDKGNSQDVYTSIGDSRQSVQAFHRTGGRQVYPAAGIVATKLAVGAETVLDVSVIGSRLTINLNGKQELDYAIPTERRPGRLALWVHQGAAEFLEVRIAELAESVHSLTTKLRNAQRALEITKAEEKLARASAVSVKMRLAADMAKYIDEGAKSQIDQTSADAVAAERLVAIEQARVNLVKAGNEKERTKAAAALEEARAAKSAVTSVYTPIGEQFAKTSTGRRSALARWIASGDNPRTARVAANHIWARHFGQPLAGTPENFGLNGRTPSHSDLLDWLASELITGEWSMKRLHKQIVLSATYRMSSQPVFHEADGTSSEQWYRVAQQKDPENVFLWRMNSRRMEAEVVRDSVLSLSRQLDLTLGGPEIPESDGEKTLRRSLYFRNTPNEKMPMLEIFDVADPNGCYRRRESVVPHQSLALMNSGLTLDAARHLTEFLMTSETDFVQAAFETVLGRSPSNEEQIRCNHFLANHASLLAKKPEASFTTGGSAQRAPATDKRVRAKENLVHVLFLHNDFVTVR